MTDPNPLTSGTSTVRILPEDMEFHCRADESIIDAIRRNGYRTRYLCRRGGCGLCKAELIDGTVGYLDTVAASVLSDADASAGVVLPCRARPSGAVTIQLAATDRLTNVLGTLQPRR
jgi:CDP-4-dehydro-6-deoxyglucose reductase